MKRNKNLKKADNSVIDNTKNCWVITTNTLYSVKDKKTGEWKEECRTEKKRIN